MATQHFLQGSYRGKLGDTVGAEWRGIPTVRTYAKPKQPQTPAQLEHYRRFRILILIANALYKIWLPKCFEDVKGKTLSNQFMSLNKGIYSANIPGFLISLNGTGNPIVANWDFLEQTSTQYTKTIRDLRIEDGFQTGDEFLDIMYFYDDKEILAHIWTQKGETHIFNFGGIRTNHPYIWIQQTYHNGVLYKNACGWQVWNY